MSYINVTSNILWKGVEKGAYDKAPIPLQEVHLFNARRFPKNKTRQGKSVSSIVFHAPPHDSITAKITDRPQNQWAVLYTS